MTSLPISKCSIKLLYIEFPFLSILLKVVLKYLNSTNFGRVSGFGMFFCFFIKSQTAFDPAFCIMNIQVYLIKALKELILIRKCLYI